MQSDREHADYFFQSRDGLYEVLIELPGTEENPKPSPEEKLAQVNGELASEYADARYVRSSATVDGRDTVIYCLNGGTYEKKESGEREIFAPTAFFEWEGHLVLVRGIGSLYGYEWSNDFLTVFGLGIVELPPADPAPAS